MKRKDRRDFHFFVGPFGMKTFDLGGERKLQPEFVRKELNMGEQTIITDLSKISSRPNWSELAKIFQKSGSVKGHRHAALGINAKSLINTRV
jgi:hypothetical protein